MYRQRLELTRALPIKIELDQALSITYRGVMKTSVDEKFFLRRMGKILKRADVKFELCPEGDSFFLEYWSEEQLPPSSRVIEAFKLVLSEAMEENLENAFTGRPMLYIRKETGIPLVGHTAFGIIVRGTNVIEVRPISGCPLQCLFCSVDEGRNSTTRQMDFMVDPDYLIEEAEKVASIIGNHGLEFHVSGQGEPTAHPYLPDIISGLARIKGVVEISLQTNGVLLDEERVKELKRAGLTRINLSLNCMKPQKARTLAGTQDYDLEHVKNLINVILNAGLKLHVSPIVIPKVSEEDMDEIISYMKKIGLEKFYKAPLGIQNYLIYPLSRKIKGIKPWKWERFYEFLKKLERKHGMTNLILDKKRDFNMEKRKELPKPLHRGEVVVAELKAPGRIKGELIAIARNRVIQVIGGKGKIGSRVRVKIERTKNNIYTGKIVG
ncbi:MAG: radical SAM protein [Candidatus Helarchaeales archaeon]